jgi:hypothetical protein
MSTREEAAAKAVANIETGTGADVQEIDRTFAKAVLEASDAHDAAHGVYRVTLDDTTVERAAEAAFDHRVFQRPYEPRYCGICGEIPYSLTGSEHVARAVLAAAVQEGQRMSASHPACRSEEGHICQQPSGRLCIEQGCPEPAGTFWGPYWCPRHDMERLDRITDSLNEIAGRKP